MQYVWGFLLIILAFFLVTTAPALSAPYEECADIGSLSDATYKVAIRPAPPFIQSHPVRGLEGISIDLWERIARNKGYNYAYVCLNLNETLVALRDAEVSVAISPLTISKNREQKFDFTHQYFTSSLVFAGPPELVSFDLERVFKTLLKVVNTREFLIGALTFLFITCLLAWVSYRSSDYYIPRIVDKEKKISWRFHIFLMAILNMAGMRDDVFSFKTIGMQFVFLFVTVFGVALAASLSGMVTASFMNSVNISRTVDMSELGKLRISTLKGSTAEDFLNKYRARANDLNAEDITLRNNWAAALSDIKNKTADLVIGDWVQLTFLSNTDAFRNQIQIHPQTLQFEPYGWGLPPESPIRESINQEMISILRSPAWPATVRGYIGSEQASVN